MAANSLPHVATQKPEAFRAWALRWLARWASESPGATIEQAARSPPRSRICRPSREP